MFEKSICYEKTAFKLASPYGNTVKQWCRKGQDHCNELTLSLQGKIGLNSKLALTLVMNTYDSLKGHIYKHNTINQPLKLSISCISFPFNVQ